MIVLTVIAVLMAGVTAAMFCVGWQLRMDRHDRRPDVGLSIFDSLDEPVHVQPSPLLQQRIVGHLHRLDQAHRHAKVVVEHGPVTREFHRIIAAHVWEQPTLLEVA